MSLLVTKIGIYKWYWYSIDISFIKLTEKSWLITNHPVQVEALTQLSMLTDALQLWSLVSQTEAMPTPPTSHGNNISNKTVSCYFQLIN